MKKKIWDIFPDLIPITLVFVATDHMMIHVFQSESLWLELGIYIILYVIVFGAKSGIVYLWKKNQGRKGGK